MRRSSLIILIISLPLFGAFVQEKTVPVVVWEKIFGGTRQENIHSMIATPDGGNIFVGETESKGAGKVDAWIFKTDLTGRMVWEKTIGGREHDVLYDIVDAEDGGYMMVGTTSSKGKGGSDLWLVKVDDDGTVEWNRSYGSKKSERGGAILQNEDGEFVIAGTRHMGSTQMARNQSTFKLDHYIWMLKVDDEGDIQWDERVHTDKMVVITDFKATSDEGYILSAISKFGGVAKEDPFIVKVDDEGLVVWKNWLGVEEVPEMINAIQPLNDGTFMLAGIKVDEHKKTTSNGWLLRMDGSGHIMWEKLFGDKGGNEFNDITLSSDGSLIMTGTNGSSSPEDGSMWLVKTNLNGKKMWERTFGEGVMERANALTETAKGVFLVAGSGIPQLLPNPDGTYPSWEKGKKKYGDVRLVKITMAPEMEGLGVKPLTSNSKPWH